jgi:hypothetical protein
MACETSPIWHVLQTVAQTQVELFCSSSSTVSN